MRYHNITKDDMLNGHGLRTVLWVAGCTHRCQECQNPVTWDINGGIEFDDSARQELLDSLSKDYMSGITFSGGDPLHPQNRKEIGELALYIKEHYSDKTIWLYTGFEWEEIKALPFIKAIDVIVDGKFVKELNNNDLMWKGSYNQRIIDVQASLKTGEVVLISDDIKNNEMAGEEDAENSKVS